MASWYALLTWRSTAELSPGLSGAIAEAWTEGPTPYVLLDRAKQHVTVSAQIEAPTLKAATDAALRAARQAATGLRLGFDGVAVQVEDLSTWAARESGRLSVPDLVGYHEIAAIAGVTYTAVKDWHRGTSTRPPDPRFPAPVLTLATGPLFYRVEAHLWNEQRTRKPGPRPHATKEPP